MLKVWASVFELPADDPHLEDAVVMCLQATRSEIEVLRVRLQALGAPEDLMHPADNLDKIRKAGEGAYTLAATVGPLLLTWGHNLLK